MRIGALDLAFNTTDMSQASCTSSWVDVQPNSMFFIQVKYTGSPVGTLVLQASNDKVVASTMDDTTTYNSTIAVSGPGNDAWNVDGIGFQWVRVVYTRTSGSGTLTGTFNGKGAPGGS